MKIRSHSPLLLQDNNKNYCMKKREPVSRIMTESLFSVNTNNGIDDVVKILKEHNIRHIPVVSGNKLIGMISKSDIERISFVTDFTGGSANTSVYSQLSIEQVMTKQLETLRPDDSIKEAAELFAKAQYHALPVVENGNLLGLVTTTDIINYLLDQY